MFVFTDSFKDVPLNDDWVYGKSVELLVQEGEFKLLDYCSSTILVQVLWGALFCLFGFSFTALRISVIVLGLIGLLAFYKIALKIVKDKNISFLATLLMLANPIYFSLSGTFMLDVPFLTLTLLSLHCYIDAINTEQLKYFGWACFFSVLAVLTRQIGLVLPFCFIFPFVLRKTIRLKPLIFSILSFLIVFFSYKMYLLYLSGNDMLPSIFSGSDVVINNLFNKSIIVSTVKLIGITALYTGLFTLPVSIFVLREKVNLNFNSMLGLSGLVFILALMIFKLPSGNIVNNLYIGPLTLTDTFIVGVNIPDKIHDAIFGGILFLSVLGVLLIFFNLIQKGNHFSIFNEEKSKAIFGALLLYGLVYVGFILLANAFFDRYLLPFFFIAILLTLSDNKFQFNKKLILLYGVFVLPMFLFTVCGFHDYIALNEARWKATRFLMEEEGIAPEHIDGGYEFNGWYNYSEDFVDYTGNTWWWAKDERYIIAYGHLPGTTILKEFTFSNWLYSKTNSIKILEKHSLLSYPSKPLMVFDAEIVSPNGDYLLSVDNRHVFDQLENRSTALAFSGDYSIEVPEYTQTNDIIIKRVKQGDYVALTFWCYSDTLNTELQTFLGEDLYKSISPKLLDSANGWKLLSFETYIRTDLRQALSLNISNKGNCPVYIDDLKIIHEKYRQGDSK